MKSLVNTELNSCSRLKRLNFPLSRSAFLMLSRFSSSSSITDSKKTWTFEINLTQFPKHPFAFSSSTRSGCKFPSESAKSAVFSDKNSIWDRSSINFSCGAQNDLTVSQMIASRYPTPCSLISLKGFFLNSSLETNAFMSIAGYGITWINRSSNRVENIVLYSATFSSRNRTLSILLITLPLLALFVSDITFS